MVMVRSWVRVSYDKFSNDILQHIYVCDDTMKEIFALELYMNL